RPPSWYAADKGRVKKLRRVCRGAAILSSLKRPAILSPFSAMKEDGTDGGVAVEAVGGGSAVGRGEAHAAGGGARAPALGAPRAPCGRRARGAPTAAAEASAPPGSQGPGRAHAPVGREPPRLAGGPRAVAVPHRGDG